MVGFLDRYGGEDMPVAAQGVDICQVHLVSFLSLLPTPIISAFNFHPYGGSYLKNSRSLDVPKLPGCARAEADIVLLLS